MSFTFNKNVFCCIVLVPIPAYSRLSRTISPCPTSVKLCRKTLPLTLKAAVPPICPSHLGCYSWMTFASSLSKWFPSRSSTPFDVGFFNSVRTAMEVYDKLRRAVQLYLDPIHFQYIVAVAALVYVALKVTQLVVRRYEGVQALESFPGPPGHWFFGHVLEVSIVRL